MSGKKTKNSIEIAIVVQGQEIAIDCDHSFKTWDDAALFLQGVTNIVETFASPVQIKPERAQLIADAIARALTEQGTATSESPLVDVSDAERRMILAAVYEEDESALTGQAPRPLDPARDGGMVAVPGQLQQLKEMLTDPASQANGGGEPMAKSPAAREEAAPAAVPACEKCRQPKTRKSSGHFFCKACMSASCSKAHGGGRKPSPQAAPVPRQAIDRQTIDAAAVSSIDPAVMAGSRPMLLAEPPQTFPWSDRLFRATLSILNSPAAARAKQIIITKRAASFKAMTPANMRTGDEPVASFHLANGCWYGTAENNPAAEYLIPEAWYGTN